MTKRNKILIITSVLSVVFIIAIGLGVGLGIKYKQASYNAVVYDRAVDWLNLDFVAGNMTYDATYIPQKSSGDQNGELIFEGDRNCPENRVYVVRNQERFKEVFSEFPVEVDFNKEMIVVYLFTDFYGKYGFELGKIKLKNSLEITILDKMPPPLITVPSEPRLRCIAIKMNKVPVKEVNVKRVKKLTLVDYLLYILLIRAFNPKVLILIALATMAAEILIIAVIVTIIVIVKRKKRLKIDNKQ